MSALHKTSGALALVTGLMAGLLVMAAPAHAGRACETRLPQAHSVVSALNLAQATAQALDASGAQVVVLARAGQDLSRYGLQWSHLGLAYKDTRVQPAAWRVVHKLNACGSATAGLYRQGLGEFFLDDLHRYTAAFSVLNPALQQLLLPLLQDNARASLLHTPAYSMVAYPWAQQYQQSNQWAIETLALASAKQVDSRQRAQAWLQLQGYTPSVLRVNAFQRLGARATAAHIAFDDHPDSERYRDRIATVTVDSVFAWLQRSTLGGPVQTVH
jgi:hypothetical protein